MEYPKEIRVNKLEEKHPDVEKQWESLEIIDDFCEGGGRIYEKRKRYIKRKPDEPEAVYRFRLNHFTYDPIIAENVNKMVTRMSGSSYVVEGLTKKGEVGEKWSKFRQNFDGDGLEENEFIESVFESLIKYKTIYAVLDFPEMGSDIPYINLFNPKTVIDHGEKDGKLQWVKIRQIQYESSRLEEGKYFMEWIFIDDEKIVKYRAAIEDSDRGMTYKDGGNAALVDQLEKSNTLVAEKSSEMRHEWEDLPVVKAEIKGGLWVTNLVCHLMKEHLKLHNNISTTAALAGQIQRLFTPLQETDSKVYDVQGAKLQTGNEHILVGQNFSFNETQGNAVNTVQTYLEKIENRIKDLLFSAGISASQIQPSQESGVAKSLDFVSQEQALKSYGQVIAKFYKQILQKVGDIIEPNKEKLKEINVNGLNEFMLDSVDNKVARMQQIAELSNSIPISQTALRIVTEDLQKSMAQYATPEDLEKIREESEENWGDTQRPDLEISELTDLVLDGIIDRRTAQYYLGLEPEEIEDQMMEERLRDAEVQEAIQSQPVDYEDYSEGIEKVRENREREKMTPEDRALESLILYLEDYGYTPEEVIEIGGQAEDKQEFYNTLINLFVEESGLSREEAIGEILADMNTIS